MIYEREKRFLYLPLLFSDECIWRSYVNDD